MVIVVMVLCMGRLASAGYIWQQTNGPYGGFVRTLAVDPTNSQTVYAGTYGGGVYKTINGGAGWRVVKNGYPFNSVYSLAIDHGDSQTVYVGTWGGGITKTTDGGTTWTTANRGLDDTNIFSVVIDQNNSQTLYAGTLQGGVYKTTNGGITWGTVNNGLPNKSDIYSIAIDPGNSQTIYAGTTGAVYKTQDGGTTWEKMDSLLTSADVYAIAVDPTNSSVVYVSSGAEGVYKTTNGGTTWTTVNEGLTSPGVNKIVFDPNNSQTIYVVTRRGGIFKSTNGGALWAAANNGFTVTNFSTLDIAPGNNQTIYAGSVTGGVFRSVDGAANWTPSNNGLTVTTVDSLAVDPNNSKSIYAGTVRGGLFKTSSNGTSWDAVKSGLTDKYVRTLVIDPANSQTAYAGTWGDGMYKTSDGGSTWAAINNGLQKTWPYAYVFSLAIDPSSSQVVYAGSQHGCVYKTGDGGATWAAATCNLIDFDVSALAVSPSDTQKIYAGTGAGVFQTSDGGATWTAGLSGKYVAAVVVDPQNSLTAYAGVAGGVYKTTDGGMSWTAVNSGLTDTSILALAIDPANGQTMYAGTYYGGVFKTINGGANWKALNNGLTDNAARSLAIDPADSKILYAGTENGGVFKLAVLPDPPGQPTGVSAVAGNGQAAVSFTPPVDNGGSAINGYTVISFPGNKLTHGLSSPISVAGLVNGITYTFIVTATNSVGTGAASLPSNSVTPMTVPGAPTGVSAIAGDGRATVVFTPPADNGGSVITGYTVTTHPDNKKILATASPIIVPGLSNGSRYIFYVTATNAAGEGAGSGYSNVITPTATLLINNGDLYTTNAKVSLSINFPGAVAMQFSANGSNWTSWRGYATSRKLSLPRGDGQKTISVRFKNQSGHVSAVYSATIILDTIVPGGSMTIKGGARYTSSRTVNLAIAAADATSGLAMICLKESWHSCSDGEFEPFVTSRDFIITSPGDGKKTIYATLRDLAGKTSRPVKATIILDTVAPDGSIVINGGKGTTSTPLVSLRLRANKATEMQLSPDGGATWSPWEKFAPVRKVTFPYGTGEKVVSARFRDLAGNESGVYSDSIILQ